MNRTEMVAIVREELAVVAPDHREEVSETANFREDLGIDSLAILEFVARLEYRFNVAVPDDAWPQLVSIATTTDYFSDSLAAP
ncbi:hypothetical protein GCM10027020_03160 [Nocardioides salsibiostraticola]